jgi:hypothetical protein
VETFKSPQREALWDYTWHARKFMEELPFWKMHPDDSLLRGSATIVVGMGRGKKSSMGGQVFTLPGEVYAIFLPDASAGGELDLSGINGSFTQSWYNPRTGEYEGEVKRIQGNGWTQLGQPPRQPEEDWVVLVKIEK